MLEVHPPHETPHSWRDFFIHIATIVVGLLIAVGLEQSVEWLHHRTEVARMRDELDAERSRNARISAVLVDEFRRITPRLEDDLKVFEYLRAHPGAPRRNWPGRISWDSLSITYLHSGWDTAQQGGILPLMPPREVRRYNEIYSRLNGANSSYEEFLAALRRAQRYAFRGIDPSAMTPAQIDAELISIEELLAAHFNHGRTARSMEVRFSDFKGPTLAEMMAIAPALSDPADSDQTKRLFKRIQAIKDEAD